MPGQTHLKVSQEALTVESIYELRATQTQSARAPTALYTR